MPYEILIGRDDADKERFGDKGRIFIGKSYVKMRNHTSLSNPIYMDVARSHVVLISGKRGSGKSYSIGVMAEELANLPKEVNQNIAPLIFDTMGIFWTMKYKNEKDKMLLKDWDLKSMNLPIRVFVPYGKAEEYKSNQIPVDESFALKASELDIGDWLLTFNLGLIEPVSVLIETTLAKLQERKEFDIDDILQGVIQSIDRVSGFEIINLGESKTINLNDLIRIIEEIAGESIRKEFLPLQPGDVQQTYANIDKARSLLNYDPQTEMKAGLQKFYDWFINSKSS